MLNSNTKIEHKKDNLMNKYAVTLLLPLLVSTPYANAAVDIFDPNSNVLSIPAVSVGSSSYSNVTVRLDNYAVLGYTQIPFFVGAVFDAPLINMSIKGFSRGQPDSSGNSTVTFSIVLINKAPNKIGIGRARQLSTDITSVLVDEKGEVCNGTNLSVSGLMDLPAFLNTQPTGLSIDNFEVLDVGVANKSA